jgi:hypothetical protein
VEGTGGDDKGAHGDAKGLKKMPKKSLKKGKTKKIKYIKINK